MGEKIAVLQKGIFVFPEFLPHAVASFSGREFDASKDIPSFLQAIGIRSDRFSTVQQIHSDGIHHTSLKSNSFIPEADGLITGDIDLALVIRTADCLPVFFFDPSAPAVGICHAGWKGTKKGIIFRMIETFGRLFDSKAGSMQIALGPSICKNCYEVGPEFKDCFPGFVQRKAEKYFFDLSGVVKKQLTDQGIRPDLIFDSALCTACSLDQFFSARREGTDTGRLISTVVLK